MLTIRANTLDPITFEIETYTPVYQHVSYYNGQMSKLKIDGKTATTFTGNAQTATDQEILIYGGSNIKRIRGISSANPDSMLIGNATKLSELDISNCPILVDVNSNKANFAPHSYLNKLNIENCPNLGGTLELSNSPLIQEIKAKGTAISGLRLPTSVKNLETLELPNTISTLALYDASSLETLKFDEGVAMQSIELSNCTGITNTENFDLTKTPTVILDNSYNTDELYMSETTNLTLRNMSNLERVIYTPNSEYSEFDINNVIGGKNYKITTNSCPKLSTFMTTAPHRDSYNGEDVEYREEVIKQGGKVGDIYELLDGYIMGGYWDNSGTYTDVTTYYQFAVALPSKGYTSIGITYQADSSGNIRVTQFNGDTFIKREVINDVNANTKTVTISADCDRIVFVCEADRLTSCTCVLINDIEEERVIIKDYGDITPNTSFTANTLDLSATQFTDIKLLCTTDVYNLKVPTTMKNFYCDSAMDIDTDVIEDASYEVIHEELIEPYTTNYEGEVVIARQLIDTWQPNDPRCELSKGLTADGGTWNTNDYNLTSYLSVVPGTRFYFDNTGYLNMYEYDKDKKPLVLNRTVWGAITLSNDTYYVRCELKPNNTYNIEYEELKIPNIVPSSANGSLIFNMYSNNTTQPTSTSPYMWDLTGLKLEDFYTYGMNNWVKPSEDSYMLENNSEKLFVVNGEPSARDTHGEINAINTNVAGNGRVLGYLDCPTGSYTITTSDGSVFGYTYEYSPTMQYWINNQASGTTVNQPITMVSFNKSVEWIKINNIYYIIENLNQVLDRSTRYNIFEYVTERVENVSTTRKFVGNPSSITMPQRMPGYSVRLVNADITPNEYPTMLYPKWIDTGLPITGKLDYTKYNGTSLAWAYAYTTGDVDISPVDSRNIGQIEFDYNKLYGTDFVDVVDVWVYKDTDTSSLSTNEAITKAYIELTSANYKTRIDEVLQYYPNCTDLYFFEDGSVTTLENIFQPTSILGDLTKGNNRLYWEQIHKITFMDGYFENVKSLSRGFQALKNLQSIHIPNNVTSLYYAFECCSNLQDINQLPNTLNDIRCAFADCKALIQVPTIPSSITNMQSTFVNCTSLTTAPVIPNGVTNMQDTFKGCTSLTTVPNIPSSCTNFGSTFARCSSLVTLPSDGYKGNMSTTFELCTKLNCQINIESANNLQYTFQGCSALTIPPSLPGTATCTMQQCFRNCTSLTTAPTIPQGVTNINATFEGCTSLTQAPVIPQGVIELYGTFQKCTSLTTAPTIPSSVTIMNETFSGCTSLTQAPVISQGVIFMTAAFEGCTSLTQAPTIPSSVTIMTSTFKNCKALTQAPTIPQGVTNMNETFRDCHALTESPVIPDSVTTMNACFMDSPNIKIFYIPLSNTTTYGGAIASWHTTIVSIEDIVWVGSRSYDFIVHGSNGLDGPSRRVISQADIKELVNNHLATVESATLTLGETYLAYLTEDEIAQATAKGWTIQ